MRKLVKILTLVSFTILAAPFATQAQEASKAQSPAFMVRKLTNFLYAIGEPNYYQKNYSYLLVGTDQALMFDSGANQKEDITLLARKITDKPLSMLPYTCISHKLPAALREQLHAKAGLQRFDLLAHRAGGDVQLNRGCCQTARAGHALKHFKIVQGGKGHLISVTTALRSEQEPDEGERVRLHRLAICGSLGWGQSSQAVFRLTGYFSRASNTSRSRRTGHSNTQHFNDIRSIALC